MTDGELQDIHEGLGSVRSRLDRLETGKADKPTPEAIVGVLPAAPGQVVAWTPDIVKHGTGPLWRCPVVGYVLRANGTGGALIDLRGTVYAADLLPEHTWSLLDAELAAETDEFVFRVLLEALTEYLSERAA